MENNQFNLNSNRLCIFCLSEVKVCNNHPFPLQHLTSKIRTNLGDVFQEIIFPDVPLQVLDRMEVMVDACEGCVHLCEEFLYKYQDEFERKTCVWSILCKMVKVGLEDKYKTFESPLAVVHSVIVNRLRKEIAEKLQLQLGEKANQSATESSEGFRRIKNILDVPDLVIQQICSYLPLEDIKNLRAVRKGDFGKWVFRSLINSSTIALKRRSRIHAITDFVKDLPKEFNNNVKLSIESGLFRDSEESRSSLLELLQQCGVRLSHLLVKYDDAKRGRVVSGGFRNSIPVLGIGKELFPNVQKLSINLSYYPAMSDEARACNEQQMEADVLSIKSLFENSPQLKELKLLSGGTGENPSLFKLIGESGIVSLETEEFVMTDSDLGNLHSLKLEKLALDGFYFRDPQSITNFLESRRDTLKHLELTPRNGMILPHFVFPRMEKLETLKLGYVTIANTENLEPISYHTQLPNLKKIELESVRPSLLIDDGKPTTSVKKLTILECPGFEIGGLMKATSAFYELSKLEIPVVKDLFNCWKYLGNLEELTLHPRESHRERDEDDLTWIDGLISGINVNYLGRILTEKAVQEYAEEYEKVKAERSLALATRLRLLRLHRSRRLLLGDVGCKLVLMKMESLKSIDFCGAHPSKVGASGSVLGEMGEKVNLMFGDIGK